jgi:membrane-associated phospholipid phosphatase
MTPTFIELGNYGPLILILLSWYLLWDNKTLLFYYTFGIFINSILNVLLKGLIQEPRPIFDERKIKLAITPYAKQYFFQNGIPYHVFGMPSGHAQTSFFTTIFIYLAFKQSNLFLVYLLFSLFICYQRIYMEFHSIKQIMVGSIVGSTMGYLVYKLAKSKIKGRIREKMDDYGPI